MPFIGDKKTTSVSQTTNTTTATDNRIAASEGGTVVTGGGSLRIDAADTKVLDSIAKAAFSTAEKTVTGHSDLLAKAISQLGAGTSQSQALVEQALFQSKSEASQGTSELLKMLTWLGIAAAAAFVLRGKI